MNESDMPAPSMPAPSAPEKGVADFLVEAFQLYRRHARSLLLTCALLLVPGSIIKSCALSLVLAPTINTVTSSADLGSLARETQAAQQALADAYARHADPATIARLQHDSLQPLAEAGQRALNAAQPSMVLAWLGTFITVFFLYGIIVPLTNGALTIAVADRILGGNAGSREVWMLLFRRLDKLLAAMIPAALLVALGMLCFVIPGLVLAFLFAFVSPVVLIEGLGGRAALRRSVDLVRSDWLRVALVVVVFAVLQAIARGLAGLFIPHSALFLHSLIGDLFMMVLMPIPILGAVLLYLDIRRKRDGFTDANLRDELAALRG